MVEADGSPFMKSMRTVRPVSPPAPYVGGKRSLSARLVDLIGQTPHTGGYPCQPGQRGHRLPVVARLHGAVYWGNEDDYSPAFNRSEFERLAAVPGTIKGRFVLSLNDVPPV